MRVEVKQHHISNGCRGDRGECPIALAVRENPPFPLEKVEVYYREMMLIPQGCGWDDVVVYPLPREASSFVANFDTGDDVEPLGFDAVPISVK